MTKLATEKNVLQQMAFNTISAIVNASEDKTVQLQGPVRRPMTITVGPLKQQGIPVFTSEDGMIETSIRPIELT